MPTPAQPQSPQPQSSHPVESSLVAHHAVCAYLSRSLHLQLEDRLYNQARSVLMQGLLEQEAANLNFSGPISHTYLKRVRIPVMHAFGTEFMVRVIEDRPVLISYVFRNGQPMPMHVRSVHDLGRLLSVQTRCPVPADEDAASQDEVQNGLPRLVSFTPLASGLHAVAWATQDTSGCVVAAVEDDALGGLKAELQAWLSAEQHATPESILVRVAFRQAA